MPIWGKGSVNFLTGVGCTNVNSGCQALSSIKQENVTRDTGDWVRVLRRGRIVFFLSTSPIHCPNSIFTFPHRSWN